MRIIEILNKSELEKVFLDLKVDPYGIKIMKPKASSYLIKINAVSSIAANILKQDMLSLGADVAVARDVLTSRSIKTDCLLIGNLSQLVRLKEKLSLQPFGLDKIAKELSLCLDNYQKDDFRINLGRHTLRLYKRSFIMGIVNLTPDSFSQDGLYQTSGFKPQASVILDFVEKMICDGADIIDIGGESSRPGAKPVCPKEELKRTIPVIRQLAKSIKKPISIDTYKPEVAKQALDNGAVIINDITGLKDKKLAKLAAQYKAGVVIMHMQGSPRTMQKNPKYKCLMDDIIGYLEAAICRALDAGIDKNKIIIDPGIGFGKTPEHNLEILRNLRELKILGKPILVGPSRKSFIGKILNTEPRNRLAGTIAASCLAVHNGAHIVRVHDVKQISESLKVSDRIRYG